MCEPKNGDLKHRLKDTGCSTSGRQYVISKHLQGVENGTLLYIHQFLKGDTAFTSHCEGFPYQT